MGASIRQLQVAGDAELADTHHVEGKVEFESLIEDTQREVKVGKGAGSDPCVTHLMACPLQIQPLRRPGEQNHLSQSHAHRTEGG